MRHLKNISFILFSILFDYRNFSKSHFDYQIKLPNYFLKYPYSINED